MDRDLGNWPMERHARRTSGDKHKHRRERSDERVQRSERTVRATLCQRSLEIRASFGPSAKPARLTGPRIPFQLPARPISALNNVPHTTTSVRQYPIPPLAHGPLTFGEHKWSDSLKSSQPVYVDETNWVAARLAYQEAAGVARARAIEVAKEKARRVNKQVKGQIKERVGIMIAKKRAHIKFRQSRHQSSTPQPIGRAMDCQPLTYTSSTPLYAIGSAILIASFWAAAVV